MSVSQWSKSEVEYGRRVLDSGLEGARSGRGTFLSGKSLTGFLGEFAHNALAPAVVGACIGVLRSCPENGRRSMGRVLRGGLLGGVVGFSVGMLWESRTLTASMICGALRGMSKVRDEHWLESHPIDYA